jgi:hypothetical protein
LFEFAPCPCPAGEFVTIKTLSPDLVTKFKISQEIAQSDMKIRPYSTDAVMTRLWKLFLNGQCHENVNPRSFCSSYNPP